MPTLMLEQWIRIRSRMTSTYAKTTEPESNPGETVAINDHKAAI
jgi:hypothetical protein